MNPKRQCAKCGSCTVVCPVFRVTGRETLAARGKMHLLSTELSDHPSKHFQDIFTQCLLCGACEESCSRQLPILERVVEARSTFSRLYGKHPLRRLAAGKVLSRPSLLQGLVKAGLKFSRLDILPADSGLRTRLGLLENDNRSGSAGQQDKTVGSKPGKDGISYFAGCMARYLQPSIGEATTHLAENLTGTTVFEPEQQVCCGLAAWSAGRLEEARRLARLNIESFSAAPGEILTSCASCSAHLQNYPALFAGDPEWQAKAGQFSERVREFTSFIRDNLDEKRPEVKSSVRIYYHEPCHLRFGRQKNNAARKLLSGAAGAELVAPDSVSQCCGQGGLFHLGYPELSDKIFARVLQQAESAGVDVVTTSCSGCLMQWQAGLAEQGSPIETVHLAVWLKKHLVMKS